LLRAGGKSDAVALSGRTILCIGGRASQMPLIKAPVERCGGAIMTAASSINAAMATLGSRR
jgi:hypothetical protein